MIGVHNLKKVALILKTLIVLALVFAMLPKYSKANTGEFLAEDELNFITQSEDNVVYEVEENGKTLRYEETINTNGDLTEIYTKVFDASSGDLIDQFNTSLDFNADSVEIEQQNGANVESENITLTPTDTTNLLKVTKDINIYPAYATTSSSWVSSRMPGINMGYRYPDDAKYAGKYKYNVKLPNKNYDSFTREVDSMRSREGGLLYESTGLAAVETLAKLATGKMSLSWSVAWSLVKKVGAPLAIAYQAYKWFQSYDRAIKYFYATPPVTVPGTM